MKLFHKRQPADAASAVPARSRRAFMGTLGAGISAALGSTAALASADTSPDQREADQLARRVARLEAEKALHELHRQYEQALDEARYEDVLALFTDDAEVTYRGEVYRHRDTGLAHLYRDHFAANRMGRQLGSGTAEPGSLAIAEDGLEASAEIPYAMQVGRPLITENSLAEMAKAQGEGFRTWKEEGAYRVTYRRQTATGSWAMSRLVFLHA